MLLKKISAIKDWMKFMDFELVKSHLVNSKNTRINYYSLGNFGIYEEITENDNINHESDLKFISWNPWGDEFEVNSVKDLSKAYGDSLAISPELSI